MNGTQFIAIFGPEYKKLTRFEKRRFLEGMLENFRGERSYDPKDETGLANAGALLAQKMTAMYERNPSPEAMHAFDVFKMKLVNQVEQMR